MQEPLADLNTTVSTQPKPKKVKKTSPDESRTQCRKDHGKYRTERRYSGTRNNTNTSHTPSQRNPTTQSDTST
ncbi:MAG: hypothetical protein IPF62_16890 [Bacteroidetes bacterium]|nr:hypothetical protein [Bacteroidota bacterium]